MQLHLRRIYFLDDQNVESPMRDAHSFGVQCSHIGTHNMNAIAFQSSGNLADAWASKSPCALVIKLIPVPFLIAMLRFYPVLVVHAVEPNAQGTVRVSAAYDFIASS